MAGPDNKVEIEVAVRDMFSGVLKQMGRELDNMNKKTTELGQSGSDAFGRLRSEQDKLADSGRKSNSSLTVMNSIVGDLTRNLAGPVGIAAAVYSVTKSLEGFTTSRVVLQNFSTDVGISVGKITNMRAALANIGEPIEQADGQIAKLGASLKGLQTFRFGSKLFQDLSDAGEGQFARKLLETVDHGDFDKAIRMLVDKTNSGTERFRSYMADRLGIPESALQGLDKYQDKVGETFIGSYKHAEDYIVKMNAFQQKLSNIWESMKDTLVAGYGNTFLDKVDEQVKLTIQDAKNLAEDLGKIKEKYWDTGQPFGKHFDWMNKTPGEALEGTDPDKLLPGGPKKGSMLDRLYNRQTTLGGSGDDDRKADELLNTEKDSNKLLKDIYDGMTGVAGSGTGGGAGGGGGGGAGSGGGQSQNPLLRNSPSFNGLVGDLKGSSGGGSRSKAFIRNQDGSDTGAVPPGTADTHTEGDGTRINRDKWYEQLQNDPALRERFFRHSLGENDNPQANQAVMEEAANRADIRGVKRFDEKGNLSYFQGFHRGPISAKQRAMLESNFNKVFRDGSDIAGGAIDNSSQWLSAKHERNGRFKTVRNFGGDRVTGHPGVETFEIPGWGESGAGERDRWPGWRARQLDEARTRREGDEQSARDTIDRKDGSKSIDANMNATVDFKNMPSWVKSNVDDNGVFKNLKITRSSPQGGKSGANTDDYSPWGGYE